MDLENKKSIEAVNGEEESLSCGSEKCSLFDKEIMLLKKMNSLSDKEQESSFDFIKEFESKNEELLDKMMDDIIKKNEIALKELAK